MSAGPNKRQQALYSHLREDHNVSSKELAQALSEKGGKLTKYHNHNFRDCPWRINKALKGE